jgi:hypothetical protein
MALGDVLDPSAAIANDIEGPGPDAGLLAGKTIGIRLDEIWRAWDWITELWATEFRAAGATVIFWRSSQGRTGTEGERIAAELEDFLGKIDIAVVGLANCGSCTGWTIRDALEAANAELPTTAVCTENFTELAQALSRRGGRSGLRLHVLPYPLNECEREYVEGVAREHLPGMLKTMGAALNVALDEAV